MRLEHLVLDISNAYSPSESYLLSYLVPLDFVHGLPKKLDIIAPSQEIADNLRHVMERKEQQRLSLLA